MTPGADKVFIAYDLRDADEAEALTAALEQAGLKVWLGWRDKTPGSSAEDYSRQLGEAANQCGAFVLVVTGAAGSMDERRALTKTAYKAGKPIFPVRMEASATLPDFPALLGVPGIDAFGPDRDANIARLAGELKTVVGGGASTAAAPPAPVDETPVAPVVPVVEPVVATIPPAPPPPPPAAAYVPPPPPPPAATYAPPAGGDEREQMLRAYIGPNADYYLRTWGQMAATNKTMSFNVAAFFLSIFWFFYRKMNNYGFILGGILVAAVIIGSLIPNQILNLLINLIEIGLAIAVGLNGNRLYRDQAEAALAQVQASTTDPAARIEQMRARGGVSMPMALISAAVWMVGIVILLYALMALGLVRTGTVSINGNVQTNGFGTGQTGTGFGQTGTGQTGQGGTFGTAPTAPPVVPQASDDSWLVGQWENTAAPSCAQWLRFGADHNMGDNASGAGTWSLASDGAGGYILSMNIVGTGLRQGPLARNAAAGTITMGAGANTVTWRKTVC